MITPAATGRVVEANLRLWRSAWYGSAVVLLVEPLLYLGALGLGLGRLTGGEGFAGVAYPVYLAPGLVAAAAMQIGAQDSAWPLRGRLRSTRTLHAVAATPLDVGDILAGHLATVALRVVASATGFALIAAAVGAADLPRALAVVAPAVLTGIAVAGPVVRVAALSDSDADLATAFRFVLIPAFVLAGTFFPVDRLPAVLRWLAYVTPLWHGGELCRAAMADLPTRLPVAAHIGYLVVWLAVGWRLAVRALDQVLRR